ncbi:AsmA family protein, partial [Candidatus Pelagibacter sp.]|nr:AsmA family protein [Candidatus Pelagibacter sp.]
MNRHNYLVRFIKKINLTITKLIKKNLNKLNPNNFIKISRSNKFFLSLVVLIVLFISYLSIPNIYNKKEISIKLKNQLQKKLNFDFNLSENFEYNFLPRPHFIYRNSAISINQNEISKIKELKVFISLKNLFSYENFKVRNLIIEKSNFNLENQTY